MNGYSDHNEIARRVAAEGMVLLENNGILPFDPGIHVAFFVSDRWILSPQAQVQAWSIPFIG